MKTPLIFALTLTMLLLGKTANAADATVHVFNVRDYGAKGDRTTKDTNAFQKALDACATAGGGEVLVPAGNYLLGSVALGANTTLHLDKDAFLTESPDLADYPLVTVRFEGAMVNAYRSLLWAEKVNHIAIVGEGGIYATTSLCASRSPRPPLAIETVNCDDVKLSNFSLQYDSSGSAHQQIWCIHPCFCSNVTVHNLYIRSSLSYGDGLDIDSCKDVLVDGCDIEVGEDAIGIKSGKGLTAFNLGKPSENVTIRNCKLATVHTPDACCIALGSEISGGLKNITISHCTMTAVLAAINLKSSKGRGGVLENIVCEDLNVTHTPTFLNLNLMNTGVQASDPITASPDCWTLLRNISFKNITVANADALVSGDRVSPEQPIQGLSFSNISGTSKKGFVLANVTKVNFSDIKLTGFNGTIAELDNVTGTGIDTLGLPPPTPKTAP